ncbi:MAG: integrase [Betaproteobacteria bacterium RIFCSPLOWO2_12_FULL_63_13]|nr:MAG: integrase [Betaproteobacteria bacterium RIFCSPLOWO2_12_FULL_63_13]
MKTLRQAVTEYLAMRRGLGFKLERVQGRLLSFVCFMARRRASHITTTLALQWAMQPANAQPANWAQRLSTVRVFARHWSATDPRTEVPPLGLLPYRAPRAKPYLYTGEEIGQLMQAAQGLPPAGGLRGWTYYCLLGLLAVTGLRISEAIALAREDVDLESGLLTVRGAKFDKTRLVPLHCSTRDMLARYAHRRDTLLGPQCARTFLVSDRGRALEVSGVRRRFYALSRQTGLRAPDQRHGPRLHDFRHRFAVETLVRWYRSGQDVERRMPVLSTYLGHAHVTDTYWYLSTCPELMGLATRRLEQRWEDRS